MAFETLNARRSVRRRYLTPRPSSDGTGFSQADRQQLRWLYAGLLLSITEQEGFVLHTATFTDLDTLTAEVLS